MDVQFAGLPSLLTTVTSMSGCTSTKEREQISDQAGNHQIHSDEEGRTWALPARAGERRVAAPAVPSLSCRGGVHRRWCCAARSRRGGARTRRCSACLRRGRAHLCHCCACPRRGGARRRGRYARHPPTRGRGALLPVPCGPPAQGRHGT